VTIAKAREVDLGTNAHFAYLDKGVYGPGWACPTDGGCKVFVDGASGKMWNYGDNFGGPTKSTWTSGANTSHNVMGGYWGVVDSGYKSNVAGSDTSAYGFDQINKAISVCPGTAGSVCRG